ncbi:hypothetical protein VTG60DRAFT_6607 [Thermothelomyces hinnuleus]
MGLPADQQSPEVVQNPPAPAPRPLGEHQLPEVVPDSSPEAAPQQPFYMQPDKYPAYYDDTPKLPTEQSPSGFPSPGHQYSSPWGTASEQPPVSALSPNSSVPWQSLHDDQATYVGSEPVQEKRICGLRRRVFGILAVVLGVIVLAAAIGGGVGGAMASKSDSKSSSTSGTPTQTATTSAASPSPTFLNNQSDSSMFEHFQFQAFSKPDFGGQYTDPIKEEGFYDFPFNLTSYVWSTNKTDCCVTFCRDENTWGHAFRCDSVRREKVEDPTGFPRVSLWCGDRLDTERQRKCS